MATAALPLSLVVDLSVIVESTASAAPTFNQGLIIDNSGTIPSYGGSAPRLRSYVSIAAILADGYSPTAPAVLAAQLYFGQTPAPQILWLGTQDPTAIATAVIDSADTGTGYVVGDQLGATQAGASNAIFKVTSIGSNGAITGLAIVQGGTGFSVASGIPLTGGTGSGAEVNITGIGETALQAVTACRSAQAAWYAFMVCGAAKADHLAIAAFAQAASPQSMYLYSTADADVPTTATTDVMSTMQALNYNRTFGIFSTTQGGTYPNNAYSAAAVMGVAMGSNTGLANSNFTLMFKQLAGVTAEPISETVLNIICGATADTSGKDGNVFVSYAGQNSWLQKSNLPNGQFFDEVLNLDMLGSDIQYSVINGLKQLPSVPQTDVAQTLLISYVNSACDRAVSRGFVAPGTWTGQTVLGLTPGTALNKGYLVQSQSYTTQSAGDRQKRKAMPIYVAIIEAGAVQSVSIGVYVQR